MKTLFVSLALCLLVSVHARSEPQMRLCQINSFAIRTPNGDMVTYEGPSKGKYLCGCGWSYGPLDEECKAIFNGLEDIQFSADDCLPASSWPAGYNECNDSPID